MRKRTCFFIVSAILLNVSCCAQKFIYVNSLSESATWEQHYYDGRNLQLTHYFLKDSVVIMDGDRIFSAFRFKNNQIAFPAYKEYYADGKLKRYDSIGTGKQHTESYFPAFISSNVVLSNTYFHHGQLQCSRLYKQNGHDSLLNSFYANGIPKDQVIFACNGNDSLAKRWDSTGILRYHTNQFDTLEYHSYRISSLRTNESPLRKTRFFYGSGILKTALFDTVISKRTVSCVKKYSPQGIISSVDFFYCDLPCHYSLVYNREGVLQKKVVKTPITSIRCEPVPGLEAAVEEFLTVEEPAEFPGGQANFEKYLAEKLIYVSPSKLNLSGTYVIRFTIDKDGTPSFLNINGLNSENVLPDMKYLVKNMPRWKPGKANGRGVVITQVVKFRVSE